MGRNRMLINVLKWRYVEWLLQLLEMKECQRRVQRIQRRLKYFKMKQSLNNRIILMVIMAMLFNQVATRPMPRMRERFVYLVIRWVVSI